MRVRIKSLVVLLAVFGGVVALMVTPGCQSSTATSRPALTPTQTAQTAVKDAAALDKLVSDAVVLAFQNKWITAAQFQSANADLTAAEQYIRVADSLLSQPTPDLSTVQGVLTEADNVLVALQKKTPTAQ